LSRNQIGREERSGEVKKTTTKTRKTSAGAQASGGSPPSNFAGQVLRYLGSHYHTLEACADALHAFGFLTEEESVRVRVVLLKCRLNLAYGAAAERVYERIRREVEEADGRLRKKGRKS
jgi:hypothetical protein